jgi:hypothetical protein
LDIFTWYPPQHKTNAEAKLAEYTDMNFAQIAMASLRISCKTVFDTSVCYKRMTQMLNYKIVTSRDGAVLVAINVYQVDSLLRNCYSKIVSIEYIAMAAAQRCSNICADSLDCHY